MAKTAERKPGSYPTDLAHVANLAALPASDFDAVLAATDLGEIWGIGRRIGAQLREAGLATALDVARMNPAVARRGWSVVLEKTVRELQGQGCIAFEDAPPAKKEIASTRSFGRTVTSLVDLTEAVSEFASRAAEKLRRQESVAAKMMVFVHTNPFRPQDKQYSKATMVPLRKPTADTAQLVAAAARGMRTISREGYRFTKAGVHLVDLQPASIEQGELALGDEPEDRSTLMAAMDGLNDRYGRGTVHVASAGTRGPRRTWMMRQERRTPDYTTRWEDIPVARA